MTAPRYEITVWDTRDGDIVKKCWSGTQRDLDRIDEQYDEPWHDIVIDREWESDNDED